MRLPTRLLRNNKNVHKNDFGHVLILAGSESFLGAAALSSLAAMRSGAGLVTLGIPQSLNSAVQKKISAVIMTLPLKETKERTLSYDSYAQIKKRISDFNVIALGPGLSRNPSTQKLILKIIREISKPLVIDADALNALAKNPAALSRKKGEVILTPHPGEMSRLTGLSKNVIQKNRLSVAHNFAVKYNCILLLKGDQTVVASSKEKIYINKTGNAGMATAGSGDVLTGMIAAFWGQGLPAFDAAKLACYIHGKAGDLAARKKSRTSLIATDIIDQIPQIFKAKK